jgi:hypothetical protein
MKHQSIGEMVRDSGADDDCPACADREDACPSCARKIHESWHKAGLWWIRMEECHPDCPGVKSAAPSTQQGKPS